MQGHLAKAVLRWRGLAALVGAQQRSPLRALLTGSGPSMRAWDQLGRCFVLVHSGEPDLEGEGGLAHSSRNLPMGSTGLIHRSCWQLLRQLCSGRSSSNSSSSSSNSSSSSSSNVMTHGFEAASAAAFCVHVMMEAWVTLHRQTPGGPPGGRRSAT